MDIGCGTTIIKLKMKELIKYKPGYPIQFSSQAGNIKANVEVKLCYCLSGFSLIKS